MDLPGTSTTETIINNTEHNVAEDQTRLFIVWYISPFEPKTQTLDIHSVPKFKAIAYFESFSEKINATRVYVV